MEERLGQISGLFLDTGLETAPRPSPVIVGPSPPILPEHRFTRVQQTIHDNTPEARFCEMSNSSQPGGVFFGDCDAEKTRSSSGEVGLFVTMTFAVLYCQQH